MYRRRNLKINYPPPRKCNNRRSLNKNKHNLLLILLKYSPLLISVIINFILVWIGILTLENTEKPIVYFKEVYFEKTEYDALIVRFINGGRTPADLKFRFEMLKVNKVDTSNSTSCTAMNQITLYPDAPIRIPWHKFGKSNLGDFEKYDYILKVVWGYKSVYPTWIPGISNYADIRYYKYYGNAEINHWRDLQYPNLNSQLNPPYTGQ